MCIIAYKPAGVEMPSDEEIKYMFNRNPDGAGFAIQGDIYGNGEYIVEYHKGFMTVEDLLDALGPKDKLKQFNVAIHCRIKTAGKIDQSTTHPFMLSTQYGDLKKLEGRGAVLFHNGVFPGLGGIIDKNSSDTQDFVVGIATKYLMKPKMPGTLSLKILNNALGGSRVLMMYPNRKYPGTRLGTWYEHNGCYYSNMGYLSAQIKPTTTYNYNYSKWYDPEEYDYDYDDEMLEDFGCHMAEEYAVFDDEDAMLTWFDLCKKVGANIVEYKNKNWYVDTVNYEAYTEKGLREYFLPGEVGHIRKELINNGTLFGSKYDSPALCDYYGMDEEDAELERLEVA